LVDGTTYYYVASAAYAGNPNSGGESADSNQVSATPQGSQPPPTPAAPTNLTARAAKPRTLDLQWVQSVTPGVTSNNVYRRLMNGGTYPSSPTAIISASTSYRDSNLSSHTGYCYVVTASSAGGESARSNEACATPK